MGNLPSGTVTFLFTDIEGSTRWWEEHPQWMSQAFARQETILRTTATSHGGYVYKMIGDAFQVAFATALDALNAAIDAQCALQAEPWGEFGPLRVRMAIHTGVTEERGDDYVGPLLNRLGRLLGVSQGGQILLTQATYELVCDWLPESVDLRDLGTHRLRDLIRPEHIYQATAPGLLSDFPVLLTLDSFPNNLPIQLTTFIGRETEIVEVKGELESHRLVTLTGSGGTGKSRLALQVAADLLDRFHHGVWFVELAPLTDPKLIPQTILVAIGISEQAGKLPLELLKEYLDNKKTLVVLDNCEHLIEASAKVVEALLKAAPQLKFLASSREALGLSGEVSYSVPSLSLPDVKHLPAIEQLSQYEAVRLFMDRALIVVPHFVMDKDNAPFIAQICSRLDGIPLAIELAAARLKMMSVAETSRRLDDRFRLLTGGARTALPRQQTLRALIDWSYDLLSEDERSLLHRLSVFAGGWTLEAAEDVCSDQSSADSEQSGATDNRLSITDILDLLSHLVNKSLVILIEHTQSGETRYRMLETIRQYAREKLLEAGSSEIVRDWHLAYFVKLAEQAEPELVRSNQVFWLNKLDDELDNFRMALEWALAVKPEAGLRIANASWLFWYEHGYLQELENWIAQLLKAYDVPDALRAKALMIQSRVIAIEGDFTRSRMIATQGLQLARAVKDKHVEALGLLNLGQMIGFSGDLGECIPMVEASLALLQEVGDKWGQATAISVLAMRNRDLERSKAFLIEALRYHRELGNLSGLANCLNQLAQRNLWAGEFSSAAQALEESIEIYRKMGSQSGEAETLGRFGSLAYWQGNYQQACAYYDECIALGEEINLQMSTLWARAQRAYAILRQGDVQRARVEFEDSLRRMQQAGVMIGMVFTIEGFASLYVNLAQPERAARLFAWGNATREKTDSRRALAEQNSVECELAVIRSQLDDTAFEAAWREGHALTVEQAIQLALGDKG
ncbi:MAG TPA: adenylate/guanylate cyclase domain-containing protein [Anaerolineales bacterium]|nr:adenylate/guanylate cyclase domain-containing protein [Anaerolineales bacterium]